jgi:uncharacterized membrane protein
MLFFNIAELEIRAEALKALYVAALYLQYFCILYFFRIKAHCDFCTEINVSNMISFNIKLSNTSF